MLEYKRCVHALFFPTPLAGSGSGGVAHPAAQTGV